MWATETSEDESYGVLKRRALAFAVDMVVLSAISALLLVPLNIALESLLLTAWSYELAAIFSLSVFSLFAWAYFTVPEVIFGSTVGKIAFGLRVVCLERGSKPTLRQAALRNVWRFIDASFFGAPAAIAIAHSPDRQRLGDRRAHTAVIAR